MTTENKPLAHQLQDRVYSSLRMLEQQDLSDDNPDLPGILVLATSLNEKLSNMTGIESVTDERAREAGIVSEIEAEARCVSLDTHLMATGGETKSIGDRLFELGGDVESVAVVAGMLATHVAGEGKEAECTLYLIERECYRLQQAINSVWSDHERERERGAS